MKGTVTLIGKGRGHRRIEEQYASKEERDIIINRCRKSLKKRFYIHILPEIDDEKEPETFIREKGKYSNTTPFGIANEDI